MKLTITSLIQKELNHLNKLSTGAKELLVSNIFYNLGIPVLLTFTTAFIFKSTQDFNTVAIFNMASFITLVIGFYINGWLLQHFSIKKIFTAGLILQGFFTLPIFFVDQITIPFIFVIGLLIGFPIAFYWANRNFINLSTTTDSNRNYYMGVESLISTITNIIAPPAIGWFIVYSTKTSLYTSLDAYRFLTIAAALIMSMGGLVLRKGKIKNPVINKLFLKKISTNWLKMRLIQIVRGLQHGVSLFLPTMLVIFLVGNEDTLGILQSLTSVIGALIVYYLGKKTLPKDRLPQIIWSIFSSILVTLVFAIFYNSWSVIIYLLGLTVAGTFTYNALNPTLLKILDDEENGDPTNNYAYIADRELFLNIGRVTGVILFYFVSTNINQTISLRVIPVVLGLMQVSIIFLVRGLEE